MCREIECRTFMTNDLDVRNVSHNIKSLNLKELLTENRLLMFIDMCTFNMLVHTLTVMYMYSLKHPDIYDDAIH